MLKLLLAALFAAAAVSHAHADQGESQDRVTVGGDITISDGQTAGDIACVFCSVHLHGDVRGDVAVLFGSVIVDQDRTISGDVAMLGGKLSLADNSSVGGDLVLVAGDVDLSPEAMIHGDRVILPGRLWLLLPFAPLLILIGVIWLIVYAIRRARSRPLYPHTRRGF